MSHYIKSIKVNEIFHLKNLEIPISDTEKRHLIITGKNGSGKTILLNAIIEHLEKVCNNPNISQQQINNNISQFETILENAKAGNDQQGILNAQSTINIYRLQLKEYFGKIEMSFNEMYNIVDKFKKNDFIIAFYAADRIPKFNEPRNPVKPNLSINNLMGLKQSKVDQFLNFMVDCKIQEALARNENKIEDADYIHQWFENFIGILRKIFADPQLNMEFNYKDYSFHIVTQGRSFKFIELSAGYAAALDIVTDLVLKMQSQNNITRAYEKEGIVLIDEIETHLHLEMQRMILPIITSIFPNIQFIVTTHSPFILNSLKNAVAFDLEHQKTIEDLTEYSYETLTEGYFGVITESSEIEMRLQKLEQLIEKESLSAMEQDKLNMLMTDFDNIPEAVAPNVKAKYYELKMKWNRKNS